MRLLIDIADIDKELLDKDLCGDERIKAILFAVKNGIPISEKENEIDNGLIDYLCEQTKLFKKYDSIAISLTGKEMFHILQNLIAERLANYSSNLKKEKRVDPWVGEKPHAEDGFVVNYCLERKEEEYVEDELSDDNFRYGIERAIESINKHIGDKE